MNSYPRISIITPVYNAEKFLETTITSVLNQGYPNLEYIIIDGGSTDSSISIIKKHSKEISYFISEADSGMYDAIQKGFEHSTGEIMGWLNADDILFPNALFALAAIFNENPNIEWIEGINALIDKSNTVFYVQMPSHRNKLYFLANLQRGIPCGHIQQESTYWRRTLWNKSGASLRTDLKYAGDYELWMRFFQHASLYQANTIIGAFRLSGAQQLSVQYARKYELECDSVNNQCIVNLTRKQKIHLQILQFLKILTRKHKLLFTKILQGYLNLSFRKYQIPLRFPLN